MVEFETEKHLPKKKVVKTKFKDRESDESDEAFEEEGVAGAAKLPFLNLPKWGEMRHHIEPLRKNGIM